MPNESKPTPNKSNPASSKQLNEPNDKGPFQPTKWILIIFFLAGLALLSESIYKKITPTSEHVEMQSQNHFVSKDLYDLYKKGQIPPSFFQLKDIKWSYYDEELKTQIPPESIPFKTTVGGRYKLEIDAFSSSGTDTKIAVLQMNIIEIESGNKVWELSRNYEIKKTK